MGGNIGGHKVSCCWPNSLCYELLTLSCSDLGWGFTPAPVIESLQKIWDIPLSKGTKVLALTIMECVNCSELRDLYRFQVNRFMRNYRKENLYGPHISFDTSGRYVHVANDGPEASSTTSAKQFPGIPWRRQTGRSTGMMVSI